MPAKEKRTTKSLKSAKDYGRASSSHIPTIDSDPEPPSPKATTKRTRAKKLTQGRSAAGPASPKSPSNDKEDNVQSVDEALKSKPIEENASPRQPVNTLEEAPTETGWRPVISGRRPKKPHGRPPLEIANNPDVMTRKRFEKCNSRNEDRTFLEPEPEPEPEEMNAHLSEKIGNGGKNGEMEDPENGDWNRHIRPRHPRLSQLERQQPDPASAWRRKPAIPSAEEVTAAEIAVPANVINGPWPSTEDYLEAHYELLREDAFAPLRDAVCYFAMNPGLDDTSEICIYEDVHIIGFTFANSGVGVKCNFSLNRAHKKIRWSHSKRLISGTLVALSCDGFQTVKFATVLARPIAGLELNPPEIDLLFKDVEVEIDPTVSWVMIESRNSYFEAYKHTLVALQRMNEKNFPLHEHIVSLKNEIPPPKYLRENPIMDLTSVFPEAEDQHWLQAVDVLDDWPDVRETTMDSSQLAALKSIITKKLAIVQGPPGTGKTYTSTIALKAMIKNMKPGDPPIIVACQTNHALDQLLHKILEFEGEIVRMGGRTQDRDEIKKRTIFEMRKHSPIKIKGGEYGRTLAEARRVAKSMIDLVQPLRSDLMTPDTLFQLGLITQGQLNAFTQREKEWQSVQDDEGPNGVIANWLEGYVYPFEIHHDRYDEMEDEDMDTEQLREIEAEFQGLNAEDEYDDTLRGIFISCKKNFKVQVPDGVDESEIFDYLKNDKVWNWPEHIRAAVYRYLEETAAKKILENFKELHTRYCNLVTDLKITRMEKDAYILEQAKVVGLTTTGLAKYRSLIAALSPKVVMIEEAAESLEGPLITACYPSVEHLILVGDHQQLRGHCNVRELEDEPYWLTVSMFERLVKNGVEFDILKTQRRMRPFIRRLLKTIYPDLEDHESVLQRPHVEGMGSVDLYFCCHRQPENSDDSMSRLNHHEADMITNFTLYLNFNGIKLEDITILTFYSGQKNLIFKLLKRNPDLRSQQKLPRIATVDSYQGEENDIIILSLVRSNTSNQIGFLDVQNRSCVALSRARRGFYIFGDLAMISGVNMLWWDVGDVFRQLGYLGNKLPLTCQRHKTMMGVQFTHDWLGNRGGCNKPCNDPMPCGHICTLNCHPFEHSEIRCYEACPKKLECGHRCERDCWQPCFCRKCKSADQEREFDHKWAEKVDDGIIDIPMIGAKEQNNGILPARPGPHKPKPSNTIDIRNRDFLTFNELEGDSNLNGGAAAANPWLTRVARRQDASEQNFAHKVPQQQPTATAYDSSKSSVPNRKKTTEMLPMVVQRKKQSKTPQPAVEEEFLLDFTTGVDQSGPVIVDKSDLATIDKSGPASVDQDDPANRPTQVDSFSGAAFISPDVCSWDISEDEMLLDLGDTGFTASVATGWDCKNGSLLD